MGLAALDSYPGTCGAVGDAATPTKLILANCLHVMAYNLSSTTLSRLVLPSSRERRTDKERRGKGAQMPVWEIDKEHLRKTQFGIYGLL